MTEKRRIQNKRIHVSRKLDISQVADTALDPSNVNVSQRNTSGQAAVDQFKALCSEGTKKALTQKIRFPKTSNCRFGTAGTLGPREACDNDEQDCWHTELNLDFTLQYVEAP